MSKRFLNFRISLTGNQFNPLLIRSDLIRMQLQEDPRKNFAKEDPRPAWTEDQEISLGPSNEQLKDKRWIYNDSAMGGLKFLEAETVGTE